MPKFYVIMSIQGIHKNEKPNGVFASKKAAYEAFLKENLLNAIRFNDWKLVEAECHDSVSLDGFRILQIHDFDFNSLLHIAQPAEPRAPRIDPNAASHLEGVFPQENESHLAAICCFLHIDQFKLDQASKDFLTSLANKLSMSFYSLNNEDQLHFIYNARLSNSFMSLMMRHWQLSNLFFEKIVQNDAAKRSQIMNSRLGQIYLLNNLRRELIPTHYRQLMPIELQQRLVIDSIQRRHAARQRPTVVMPELKEGLLTKKIGEEGLAGRLEIPKDLICPISGDLFKEPVVVNQNGKDFYFEKLFILEALKQKKENPLTRQAMSETDLKPAPQKAEEVRQFKEAFSKKLAESGEEKKTSSPKR